LGECFHGVTIGASGGLSLTAVSIAKLNDSDVFYSSLASKSSHMATESITIKGTSEGLIISLGEGPLCEALEEMERILNTKASFFLGGRVALRAGDRALSGDQLTTIGSKLEALGMTLWAVGSEQPATIAAAQELGLETHLRSPKPVPPKEPMEDSVDAPNGLVMRGTLRSGQALHHIGHVTLIGDVNPGGEVVAGGDIVIWGKLRGTAHAGARGDESAIICALQLAPSQIRIASYIARPPERSEAPHVPEIASVQEDRIVVERWSWRK
jgi:septum site-determining protein MinC